MFIEHFRVKKVSLRSLCSPQYRRILDARLHIFVLNRHLGFDNCGGLGRGNITERVGVHLHQSSTGQASKIVASKPDLLSSVPLQNNACTAGYLLRCSTSKVHRRNFHSTFYGTELKTMSQEIMCCVRIGTS